MSSHSPWKIRNATLADIELIRSLCQRIWPAAYAHILSAEQLEYMMEWMYSPASLQQQIQDGAQFLILYYQGVNDPTDKTDDHLGIDDSEAAGYASFQLIENTHYKLHKLYVLPELQGMGGGRYLVDHIVQQVTDEGGHSIELQVNRNNKAAAFYKQLGFQIIKEGNFPIGNGYYMNDYIMQISLQQ